MSARLALYWAPDLDDPLHALGSAWLGRDAETGATLPQPSVPGLDLSEITAEARGYGLHATLKAPFRFDAPYAALRDATMDLAARTRPFALPPLAPVNLGGFVALREAEPCAALGAFADACVTALDRFRLPPTEAEMARRRPERLTPRQRELLERWGYHYVLDEWRFHVTLSRRLDDAERALLLPAVQAQLGAAAARPRVVRSVCLFTQAAAGAPFLIAERLPLLG
jgi:putative phosphonate metabolism protein